MDRKFFYAIDVWENRASATYRPLYEPYVLEPDDCPRMTVFDPYGRQLGDPNFYDWRPPCKEEVSGEVRYFTFRDSAEKVVLYKEEGYRSDGGGGGGGSSSDVRWGDIGGTLSNQSDLSEALAGKASVEDLEELDEATNWEIA